MLSSCYIRDNIVNNECIIIISVVCMKHVIVYIYYEFKNSHCQSILRYDILCETQTAYEKTCSSVCRSYKQIREVRKGERER